ncbi:dephospho-CoA kinase [Nesterenkonia ebinurensis]|uniref:dephospho-CoA kinase n=1 Tax=Nesterenkonia ebinurensis TaxID=2608252 RepID=UPI001CC6A116|nr:dephospho-CoA kinase [Nesterenkonia ebinurensis]
MAKILSVGLTGGIASGKSAVSQRLAEHGAVIIDADKLAHQAVAPGAEGLAEIVEAFGDQVLTSEGALDRQALSRIVFNDDAARSRLNAIIHPRVRAASAEIRDKAPEGSVVVEDIPLLVETGQQERFDVVVVVQAPREERLRRLQETRGMSREEAERIFNAQATDAQRAAVADILLENSGTLEDLTAQIDELWQDLCHGR